MEKFLQKVARETSENLLATKKKTPVAALRESPLFSRRIHEVLPTFRSKSDNIIAEIKFASPSEGDIHINIDPIGIAKGYRTAGAAMLSVLTEPSYFKGSLRYLKNIRETDPDALLLRKDFIVDPYQLFEARAHGADAVLLIVAMTDIALTRDLLHQARELDLTPLVEVHSEAELAIAIDIGADFIGINNRDLKTLKIDLNISRRLARLKPEKTIFICESGLSGASDLRDMRDLGYDGFLMGTTFMRQQDPGAALAALKEELSCA